MRVKFVSVYFFRWERMMSILFGEWKGRILTFILPKANSLACLGWVWWLLCSRFVSSGSEIRYHEDTLRLGDVYLASAIRRFCSSAGCQGVVSWPVANAVDNVTLCPQYILRTLLTGLWIYVYTCIAWLCANLGKSIWQSITDRNVWVGWMIQQNEHALWIPLGDSCGCRRLHIYNLLPK